jgi:hypothetical protein
LSLKIKPNLNLRRVNNEALFLPSNNKHAVIDRQGTSPLTIALYYRG